MPFLTAPDWSQKNTRVPFCGAEGDDGQVRDETGKWEERLTGNAFIAELVMGGGRSGVQVFCDSLLPSGWSGGRTHPGMRALFKGGLRSE